VEGPQSNGIRERFHSTVRRVLQRRGRRLYGSLEELQAKLDASVGPDNAQ